LTIKDLCCKISKNRIFRKNLDEEEYIYIPKFREGRLVKIPLRKYIEGSLGVVK
jgi:predicted transposase YbfD/YdcC